MTTSTSENDRADLFATTHWTVLRQAGVDDSQGLAALQQLCQSYWRPVYVFIRGRGFNPNDAEDLTQEFFGKLLQSKPFAKLDQKHGKFRAFLLAAAKNFLANEFDKTRTLKRGGGQVVLSLDRMAGEAWVKEGTEDAPDRTFEKRWAQSLLERALARLAQEFADAKQSPLFHELKPALTGDPRTCNYREMGARFGMKESAVKVRVHRMRERYRVLLKAEVAATVGSPEEIEEELRYLFTLF